MNDNIPFYQRLLGALRNVGGGIKDVFVDNPNARGQQMMDAERARNEAMMRENGLMNEGQVATSTNPELFENPLPFAPQMADFIKRLQAVRNK